VVAAAGEFAGHRQQRELAAEAGFDAMKERGLRSS
jgi:hypothetical protein